MNVRDRIVELRRVSARDLAPSPKNWRKHPKPQRDAMRGLLAEIGYAGALLARQTDAGLMLIDGHLRAELTSDQEVPVLILDVDEREADLILATYDPIGAMATANAADLDALLRDVDPGSEALQALLVDVAERSGVVPPAANGSDLALEWAGMPEFVNPQLAARQITISFLDAAAVDAFSACIGQQITAETKSLWFPPRDRGAHTELAYSAS